MKWYFLLFTIAKGVVVYLTKCMILMEALSDNLREKKKFCLKPVSGENNIMMVILLFTLKMGTYCKVFQTRKKRCTSLIKAK